MADIVLENLSNKKLTILITILIICQITCFLVGGLIAPTPANADLALGVKCMDEGSQKLHYTRGKGFCRQMSEVLYKLDDTVKEQGDLLGNVVYVFQLPLPRDNEILDYSRWQQNLIGMLQIDIAYDEDIEIENNMQITLDSKIGYRNKHDNVWTLYASSIENRSLDCTISTKRRGYIYDCTTIPLFELPSLYYDYYVINIRFPYDQDYIDNLKVIQDLWLITINQNGGFTKVWLSMKTVFFPIIIVVTMWFWRRVCHLSRQPALLEHMLLSLGCTLTLLNAPFEYLTLLYDIPFMQLFEDFREGLFYAALLSFWLVFAGEHLLIQSGEKKANTLRAYWKHLSAVIFGCFCLFLYDICERGMQLVNPFFSFSATDFGSNVAFVFIILAAVSAGVYFVFLTYMIVKAFRNIGLTHIKILTMSEGQRLHYGRAVYRFKFLMIATLLCAALTVIEFILGQISEEHFNWDGIQLEMTSAVFTGVYGMWNIYIFALLALYAPSAKHWLSEKEKLKSISEEIESLKHPQHE